MTRRWSDRFKGAVGISIVVAAIGGALGMPDHIIAIAAFITGATVLIFWNKIT